MNYNDASYNKESVNLEDYGMIYGFGIFETFLVDTKGEVFLLEKHVERLMNSAAFFGIDYRAAKEEIMEAVSTYISKNLISNVILRITLYAGNKQKGISPSLLFSCRKNIYTRGKILEGCSLCLTDVRKSESSIILRHKTLNYMENHLLLQDASNKGFDDVLLANSKLNVTETAKSNIFFVKKEVIHTPDSKCGLLPGIIRHWILGQARLCGLECLEGVYGIEDFLTADEVFVSNSAMGIMHVRDIDRNRINNGTRGDIAQFLQSEWIKHVAVTG